MRILVHMPARVCTHVTAHMSTHEKGREERTNRNPTRHDATGPKIKIKEIQKAGRDGRFAKHEKDYKNQQKLLKEFTAKGLAAKKATPRAIGPSAHRRPAFLPRGHRPASAESSANGV